MDDILFSSSSDEWATPQPLFDQISEMFGPFDLDPCCTPENKKGLTGITKDSWTSTGLGGLHFPWGDYIRDLPANVFVNPPFCRKKKMFVDPWIEKAWEEVQIGNASQVVMLIPARTDTKVWHNTIFPHANLIAFLKARVRFDGPSDGGQSATFPSAIVVFRRVAGAGALKQPPFITTWEQRR